MGHTTKPCPGCGEINSARGAKDICSGCKMLIEEAKATRARMEQKIDTGIFKIPYAYYTLPYIAHCRREPIQNLFQELILGVGEISSDAEYNASPLIEKSETDYGQEHRRRFPLAFREHANELYKAIQHATKEAYQTGYEDGQKLLVQLARGEVSLDTYREESGELARRKQ